MFVYFWERARDYIFYNCTWYKSRMSNWNFHYGIWGNNNTKHSKLNTHMCYWSHPDLKERERFGDDHVTSNVICADDMILYIEDPEDPTKKWLEPINYFSKFSRYKISTQKSVVYLYMNNILSERELKTIPSTIASKK